MSVKHVFDYDVWFDIFFEHLRIHLRYEGKVLKGGVKDYYEVDEMYPEEAAEKFYAEMTNP